MRRHVGSESEAGGEQGKEGWRRARWGIGIGRREDERGRTSEKEISDAAGGRCVGIRVARGQGRGAWRVDDGGKLWLRREAQEAEGSEVEEGGSRRVRSP